MPFFALRLHKFSVGSFSVPTSWPALPDHPAKQIADLLPWNWPDAYQAALIFWYSCAIIAGMSISRAVNSFLLFVDNIQHRKNSIVVGIDGYSGIGKTTLLRAISAARPNIPTISLDDYACTANTQAVLLPALTANKKSLPLQWAPPNGLDRLRRHISTLKVTSRLLNFSPADKGSRI